MISQLLIFGLIAATALWWWDSNRARERALGWARSACARAGVQLLDQTVAVRRTRFRRDSRGRVAVWRYFGFEFTDTGDRRCQGHAVLLGDQLLDLHLDLREDDQPRSLH
ncbi:MAG: DUF3301 domain-containing protein [Pseudomonadota bacterium]